MAINKRDKIIIISIIVGFLIVSLYLIFNVFEVLKYKGGLPKDIIYTSDVNDSEEYTIHLKNNDFFDSKELPSGSSYISSLVQYIKTRFFYEYVGNNNVKVNYTYKITSNVIAEYMAEAAKTVSNPVWSKEFVIVKDKTGSSNDSHIKIDESFNFSLDYYNKLVNDFINDFNIPINARLEVKLLIDINGTLKNNHTFSKEHMIVMTIPLGVKAFDVNISKNIIPKEITYNKTPNKAEVSYMLAIVYIALLITIAGVSLYFIKSILNKHKNPYVLKVSKILKEYDDRIVTVSNFIKYEKLEIVDMPSFDDLLTFSDETLEPIIYWEKRDRQAREAWFSILRNRILYRYIVPYKKK